jgi:hypothetical protein
MEHTIAITDKNFRVELLITVLITFSLTLIAYLWVGSALTLLLFIFFGNNFYSLLRLFFFKHIIGLSFDDTKRILAIRYYWLFTERTIEVDYFSLNYLKPKWHRGRTRGVIFYVEGKKFTKVTEYSHGWSRPLIIELAKEIQFRNFKKWEH